MGTETADRVLRALRRTLDEVGEHRGASREECMAAVMTLATVLSNEMGWSSKQFVEYVLRVCAAHVGPEVT